MKIEINGYEMNIFITRKKSNKNTYLRVKEDLNIYVTTNYLASDKFIYSLVNNNKNSIIKMLDKRVKQKHQNEIFTYLGKEYRIIYINNKDVNLGEEKIFIPKEYDINKWLKKQALLVYKEELDKIYNIFPKSIPYPSLTIRSMKTRWGVCNIKTKKITLNLELIKKDIKYLDYVIVHELSHLIYPNHSKDFWNLVSLTIPDYKKLRKELNSYE